MTDRESRSPLKGRPLRNPGQGLDERLDVLINEKAFLALFMPFLVWLFAAWEWFGQWRGLPRLPTLFAGLALLASIWGGWQFWGLRREIRRVKLGRDGERAVGQFLEDLRRSGARVFHDVPAGEFNLDHVVICSKGVFVVETKTWSKPSGSSRISVREGVLLRDGVPAEGNVLGQALGEAAWLRAFLLDSTGERYPVHPVVVFPGWFVEPLDAETKSRVWVLEPKALPSFLAQEPERLTPDRVGMAARHLGVEGRRG